MVHQLAADPSRARQKKGAERSGLSQQFAPQFELHRHSIPLTVASGVICGIGPFGYSLALLAAMRMLGAVRAGMPDAMTILPTR